MAYDYTLQVDVEGLIGILRSNLNDRYKDCFCIIQELLQNADDAGECGSRRVHFGVMEPLGTNHPLGKVRGFYIVNDGPITKSNMQSIFKVAAGDKGNETDKIGKFGLGMKSVFHVCEGFFMFGRGHEVSFPQFCTPWLSPYHKEWHEAWTESKDVLAKSFEEKLPKEVRAWEQLFCVWLPLRSKYDQDRPHPIVQTCPRESDIAAFTGSEYANAAARFLPLLKHVEEVSFSGVDGGLRRFVITATGRLKKESGSLVGSLKAEGADRFNYQYSGRQLLLEGDGRFSGLQGNDNWPRYSRWDEENAGYVDFKDKVSPHVAVCCLTEPSEKPVLDVVPCVYLPLSGVRKDIEDSEVTGRPSNYRARLLVGNTSVTLYLHGSFFVDAARENCDFGVGQHPVENPSDEKELKTEWNRRLFSEGVLPLVVPQLFELLKTAEDRTATAVMEAIRHIPFLKPWIATICKEHSIVRVMTKDGYEWRCVPSSDCLYVLPRSECTSLIRRVICESLPDDIHIVDSDAGYLTHTVISSGLSEEVRISILRTVAEMRPEESDNRDLMTFVRDKCASGLKFDDLDDQLRRAQIWKVGGARLSYEELKGKAEGLQIYCDATPGLKKKLLSAIVWPLESAPKELGEALGLRFRKLDVDFVIDIMHVLPELGEIGARRELLAELKRGVAQDADRRRRAVRYLVHGSKDLFDNTKKLYTPDTSLPSDFADVVLKALSAALYHHSYSMPADMLAELCDTDQEKYGFGRLTRDSVAVVLADTPGISYAGFPADAWQTLLRVSNRLFTDDTVKFALKRIPIFPFEDGGRGALSESCYCERNVKIPGIFRNKVHVLSVPKDEDIAKCLEELVQSWKYVDTFRYCRESSLPVEQLSEVLMDAVTRTPSLTGEDRAYLETTKWVPMVGGGYCSPDSIMNISDFVPPEGVTEMLPLKMFEDRTLELLRRHELLPEDRVCVQSLFADLAKIPRYHLGLIHLPDGVQLSCDSIFSIFRNRDVLPVVPVLLEMGFVKQLCDDNLRQLVGPIDPDLVLGVITELTTRLRECRAPSEQQLLWTVLCSYLEEAAEYDESMFSEILSACSFLNLNLKPCRASVLCTGGESVPSDNIVHDEYRAAGKFFSRLWDNVSYYVKEDKSVEYSSYQEYFADWEQEFDARIGGFIVCTSDIKSDIDFVRRRYWTDSRSIRENRNKLNGEYDQLVSGQCAYLHAKKGSKIVIRTLIGTAFEVSMKSLKEVDDLFVAEGAPLRISPSPSTRRESYNGGGPKLMIMRLRYVTKAELEELPSVKIDALLKNTLHKIASALCGAGLACDIDNFWGDLASGEQLSISVTRAVMLNHASYYLGMLGCQDEKLDQYFSEQKELETVIEDARKSKGGSYQQYLAKKDALARDLGRLIETDVDVARHILEALRNEMRNRYEYNETSILYELFQNADDASEQLYAINPDETTKAGRFEVCYDGKTLIVAHWGRVINSVASAGGAGLAHCEFKRDLENMLMLMQSGKKITKIPVTGKFGLGFKTVFFVCDEPIVYSGALRFKIHGGFLPQPLPDEDNEKYSLMVRRFAEEIPGSKPTVFVLPIVPQQRGMMERCIEQFSENVQTVCTLAKRIGRVRITTQSGDVKDVRKAAFDGALSADGDRFVIDLADGSIFFGNKNGIPVPLPDEEATYWATVPTKLRLKMGFALNGGLDLTTGRAKINDSSTTNPKLIAKWSNRLLDELKKIDTDVRKKEDGGYAFFAALWDLFTVRREIARWEENPETNLLRDLLWDERSGGYRRYLCSGRSIPSGLTGRLRSLCSPMAVSHVVSREIVNFELLSLLDRGTLIPGCAVAEEVFVAPAERFFKDVHGLTKYGMLEFLTDLQMERPVLDWKWCSSEAGSRLLQALEKCNLEDESKSLLRNFLFMTNGGATKKAENLVGTDGYDEKRMAFVPADYQLSSQYDETGIAFFKLIRGERRIQTEELARLAARASTLDEQDAALRYVLETHDIDFIKAFKSCNATWMKDVASHPYFVGLEKNNQMLLAVMLGLELESVLGVSVEDPLPPPEQPKPRPPISSSAVRDWWSVHAEEEIKDYNHELYGRNDAGELTFEMDSIDNRKAWMELLVLGAAHSLGMRKRQHKGFICELIRRGYWDVYCKRDLQASEWLDTIDDFLENEELNGGKYSYWMRLFFRIYQFSRNLDTYVQLFKSWNWAKKCEAPDLAAVKENSMLSGSNIDAPGLQKALSLTGLHFVYREMVRRHAITNPLIHPQCFVPYETVAEVAWNMRNSEEVYRKIVAEIGEQDATFGGAFDIALTQYDKHGREG